MKASIIILNYFGEKTISPVIDSVLQLKFQDDYELIIVDNASTDNSLEIIKNYTDKFPNKIKLIASPTNLGFSKGNNLGIKEAKGEYIVLLNNDCIVDPNWLENLLAPFAKNKNIFAVNSKILLYAKYLKYFLPTDTKKVCLLESNIFRFSSKPLPLVIDFDKDIPFVELPFDPTDKLITLQVNDKNITIDTSQYSTYSKIQNAGSLVFQDGYGRDIGAVVKNHTQNYEIDTGQYEQTKEVFSVCGAAVAFSKKILDKIGPLNELFFMYYEDTEISERARNCGYINVYEPKAIVRHLHAFSSKEWSPFFIYHVEKGRLLHTFFHFPIRVFMSEYISYSLKSLAKLVKRRNYSKEYNQVSLYFILRIFQLANDRIKLNNIYNSSMREKTYSTIINGYWYEN